MFRLSAPVLVAIFCLTAASPADEMTAVVNKCQTSQGISDLQSIMNEASMTLKDESNEAGRLKGNKLDAGAVIDQAKDMIQYAKTHGIRLDENEMKSSVEDCSRKDGEGKCMKAYRMWTCLNDFVQKVRPLPACRQLSAKVSHVKAGTLRLLACRDRDGRSQVANPSASESKSEFRPAKYRTAHAPRLPVGS
ncbi:hypothetical protein B7P43_G05965 [Cryptotermes secundus]|uniref:Uncharacterized protein n=1 Tax=Cryptotermes secundus TaxID=105785 RepID=A0A2J7PZT5_9NEOP|nr:hypothetical protein B7P43_G05965 [Cryptotermes secundus]